MTIRHAFSRNNFILLFTPYETKEVHSTPDEELDSLPWSALSSFIDRGSLIHNKTN